MSRSAAWFTKRFTVVTGAASSPASSITCCTASKCRRRCGKTTSRRRRSICRSRIQTVVGPPAGIHSRSSSTANKDGFTQRHQEKQEAQSSSSLCLGVFFFCFFVTLSEQHQKKIV